MAESAALGLKWYAKDQESGEQEAGGALSTLVEL